MTVAAFVKDPNVTKDYPINWAARLVSGDTITASTWVAEPGITIGTGGQAPTSTTTTTLVWLSGGTVGVEYKVTNHITTAQGRTDDQTLIILILET